MKLYFLRHATASHDAARDELRELTAEGRVEARQVGQALARLGARPGAILTSPLVRARQTAALAGEELGMTGKIVVLEQLANGTSTAKLIQSLKPFADHSELLLVGHLPSFPEHIAILTGAAHPSSLHMGKGSVACVQLDSLKPGSGILRWLMGKKQLRLTAAGEE